jgi:hypothetical protein
MDRLGRTDFINALTREFPEVLDDVDPDIEGGLLHLEMAALARAAQVAVNSGREADARRHFEFVYRLLPNADDDLDNAIYVSFLEGLTFVDAGDAQKLLPPGLHAAWVQINRLSDQL